MRDAWYLCYERIRKEEKNRLFTMFSRHRSVPSQCKKFILLGEALRNGRKNGTEKKNRHQKNACKTSGHILIYQLTAYQSQISLGHWPS